MISIVTQESRQEQTLGCRCGRPAYESHFSKYGDYVSGPWPVLFGIHTVDSLISKILVDVDSTCPRADIGVQGTSAEDTRLVHFLSELRSGTVGTFVKLGMRCERALVAHVHSRVARRFIVDRLGRWH
jgi:hypothetical protein